LKNLIQVGPVEQRLLAKVKRGPIVAALIDPDEFTPKDAAITAKKAIHAGASLVLVGGSTVSDQSRLDSVVISIKHHVSSPVVLFPGNVTGVSKHADAILFSSLLNSMNPYFIIGAQALGAAQVFRNHLEAIPMGYLIFGESSAAAFIGQVNPMPRDKPSLAIIYCLAASLLGMRSIYLEAGSGSGEPLSHETVRLVRRHYPGMIMVGGGITSAKDAGLIAKAGADILVVGNLLERDQFEKPLREIVSATRTKRRNRA